MRDSGHATDHIGWDLWRAAQQWKREFVAAMVAAGHPWFGEARANLFHLIDREGAKQSELVAKSQLSKQAVQQFIVELEADGLVKRVADPDDARARLVRLTEKGGRALHDAQIAKRMIERKYEEKLGKGGLARLKSGLDKIAPASE